MLHGSVGRRDQRATIRLTVLSNTRRRRNYALQQSINPGEPYVFRPAPSVATWVVGLEDRRMVHGGLIGGEVLVRRGGRRRAADAECDSAPTVSICRYGMDAEGRVTFVATSAGLAGRAHSGGGGVPAETFYEISGWKPVLMEENRLKALQQEQINQAIEDQRATAGGAVRVREGAHAAGQHPGRRPQRGAADPERDAGDDLHVVAASWWSCGRAPSS